MNWEWRERRVVSGEGGRGLLTLLGEAEREEVAERGEGAEAGLVGVGGGEA